MSLLQNLFFGARLIIRFCVSVPFLRLKSGIKSGCKINILQKNDFFSQNVGLCVVNSKKHTNFMQQK